MIVFDSLALALGYLDRHFYTRYIFPIKAGAKFPPLVQDNLATNASNDPKQIIAWSKKWPGCNWGVAHRKSTLLVVDVDCNETKGKVGQQTFDALALAYDWPETEKTTTPSGGFHLVYEGEHIMALGENGIGKDIDSPNYTLIAGCVFKDGTSYVGDDAPAVACPSWIYDVIKNAKSRARITDAADVVVDYDKPENIEAAIDFLQNDAVAAIEGSGGDFNTLKAAMYLKDLAISPTLAVDLLNDYYNPRCVPPWDREGLETKVTNAYAYSSLSKVGGKTAEADFADDAPEPITPMGIYNQQTKTYDRNVKNIAISRRERATARAREAARPESERERYPKRAEVIDEWVWVVGIERALRKDNTKTVWKKSAFDSAFAYLPGKGEPKSFLEALLRKNKGTIARFHEIAYKPGQPQAIGNGLQFNTYTPSDITPAEGDVSWWDDHLVYLFPTEEYRNHVLNWMAWMLQNLALKPKHALLVQGHWQGTGKSFLSEMLSRILGASNVSNISQNDLHGDFNGWAIRSKLLIVEELRAVDRTEVTNKLHPLVTQEMISVNEKNLPQRETENCFGIFAMTNSDAALSLDVTDRRYLVVRTDAVPRDRPEFGADYDPTYYDRLYSRLYDPVDVAAVAYALMSRDVGAYDGRAAAPRTAAKEDMIEAGLGDLEHFMAENANSFPLSGRVIAVQDVIDILPKRLESRSSRLAATIKSVLKKRFKGEELGQRTLKDRSRHRLMAINGCPIKTWDKWEERVAMIYEADKAKAGKGRDIDDASEEFGVDSGTDAE